MTSRRQSQATGKVLDLMDALKKSLAAAPAPAPEPTAAEWLGSMAVTDGETLEPFTPPSRVEDESAFRAAVDSAPLVADDLGEDDDTLTFGEEEE